MGAVAGIFVFANPCKVLDLDRDLSGIRLSVKLTIIKQVTTKCFLPGRPGTVERTRVGKLSRDYREGRPRHMV
jgi:hypothetical protein